MAGDWIKMRTDLFTHPKVFKIAEALDKDELYAVGALFAFWSWIDRHAVDGRVDGATTQLVDRATRVDGLADALMSVGWLSVDGSGISIPEFGEHNGDSAKERSLKNQRQARWRERKASGLVDEKQSTSASTRPSTNASTREEKRRDIKNPPIPPDGEGDQTGGKSKRTAVGLPSYLQACRKSGVKPIPEGDTVFAYAEQVGIPLEFLRLHWLEFKTRYSDPGAKRYKDWAAVHRKSVRGNWFKLWFIAPDGAVTLTTVGEQARRAHGEAA